MIFFWNFSKSPVSVSEHTLGNVVRFLFLRNVCSLKLIVQYRKAAVLERVKGRVHACSRLARCDFHSIDNKNLVFVCFCEAIHL